MIDARSQSLLYSTKVFLKVCAFDQHKTGREAATASGYIASGRHNEMFSMVDAKTQTKRLLYMSSHDFGRKVFYILVYIVIWSMAQDECVKEVCKVSKIILKRDEFYLRCVDRKR